MNTKIPLLFLLFSLTVFSLGCVGNLFDSDKSVKIRIQNSSEFELENIRVSFPDEEVSYGTLGSSEVSSYQEVNKAYRYAYIESEINGERAVLQPIDYVGEDFLDSGKYTYKLSVYGESGQAEPIRYYLGLELMKN